MTNELEINNLSQIISKLLDEKLAAIKEEIELVNFKVTCMNEKVDNLCKKIDELGNRLCEHNAREIIRRRYGDKFTDNQSNTSLYRLAREAFP